MSFFISTLLLFSTLVATAMSATNKSSELSEPMCYDWGESRLEEVLVVEGEVGWLSCPLFSHPSVYNYSSTPSAGHNLVWYRHPEGHDLEQPITYSSRLSKDRERLWLQPAAANDSGNYICMLRNKSSCSKMARRLRVLRLDEAVQESICQLPVAVATTQVVIPLQEGEVLDCPDVQDAAKMADSQPTVTWWHSSTDKLTHHSQCDQSPLRDSDRQQKGVSLQIHVMMENYQGLYYCRVQYQRRKEMLNFTRVINVTAVNPRNINKEPYILQPTTEQVFTVRQDSEVRLVCRAMFPYLGSPWDIWWTVDGKTVEQLTDQRFSNKSRLLTYDFGDWTVENVLLIQDFQPEDLNRKYNCSVRNERGFDTRRAQLQELEWLPSVELGCGLVVTLLLMLLLFVVYHVFWLELLLLYRSWFGTDERHTDDKEYDVYISYARNSEEEQFVLSTLRRVLENELGYTVCIFDRDSLPGGSEYTRLLQYRHADAIHPSIPSIHPSIQPFINPSLPAAITDETLRFVARSRRLLVVVSPGYASQGSQALLELKAGIDGIMGGHLRVILVQYKPFRRQDWVRELRRARVALALVRWQGDKSNKLTSRFWKRLKVELPVRRDSIGEEGWGGKDMGLMRLHSQNSTSSQTGLITNTLKDPQTILNSAA